jgi:dTDP-glucose 4,6-dehydratase
VRDWLYVGVHCTAIRAVLERGRIGETYNVGGDAERQNIEVVRTICALLDERRPRADGQKRDAQITYVAARPGHDRRYAIDASKLKSELGWAPAHTFEQGSRGTVDWYLAHQDRVQRVTDGSYRSNASGRPHDDDAQGNHPRPAGPARGCIRSPRRSASSCCRCTTSR